jgi:hypothetical protein
MLKMKILPYSLFLIILILSPLACNENKEANKPAIKLEIQPIGGVYIQYSDQSSSFRIGNELIERTIVIDKKSNHVLTSTFTNKLTQHNYVSSVSEEFSFRMNGTQVSGVNNIEYISHNIISNGDIKSLELNLKAKLEGVGTLNIILLYEVYSHIPAIRKWIMIENPTGSSITVDSIIPECLNLLPGLEPDIEGRDLVEYLDNKNVKGLSPVVINTNLMEGFILGNESPGATKYYNIYSKPGLVEVGMKPFSEPFAPEIQLAPGENFTCPATFVFFFKGNPMESKEVFFELVSDYVSQTNERSYSVSFENILAETTEKQVSEKVNSAKESGANIFCLSGNWMDKRGDWTYEKNAYIKNLNEQAHKLGIKFGLCVDVAVAEPDSIVLNQHPQWIVKSKDGADYKVPDTQSKLMCMGSEYTLYMAYEIDSLVKELNLDYIKLTGAIIPTDDVGGCFAEGHLHRTRGEYIWNVYDGLFALIMYLHGQHPDLIVDVSLESYNPPGSVDYALLKNSDVNWSFH